VGEKPVSIYRDDKYNRDVKFYGSKGPEYAILLNKLEEFGWNLKEKRALEMFAGTASFRTVDIISRVGDFEGWEINNEKVRELRKEYPDCRWKVGSSIELAQDIFTNTIRCYDLISLDSSVTFFGENYCEHFDIADIASQLLNPIGALLMNVTTKAIRDKPGHQERREEFYGQPAEDISLQDLDDFYREYFEKWRKRVIYTKFEPHCYIDGYNFGLFIMDDK